MKAKEFVAKHKKKIICITVVILILAMVAVGILIYFMKGNSGNQRSFGQKQMGGFGMSGEMISASGVTSTGMILEEFEVENLETELEIEEVYISSEQEIEEGTPVLKLSEESVAEAREELEKELKDADLAARAGLIEYQQQLITAEYDRDSALLSGEQAQAIYDETVAGLESNVEKAQEALDDAKEQIAEYESYVNDGTYSTYFKVDEYQAIYDENLDVLEQYMEEWGLEWSDVTSGGHVGSLEDVHNQYVMVLSSLYSVLEQNYKDLESAQNDYEDAVQNASFELQTLQLNLPSLEQALAEAKEKYETEILNAKLTLETSLANAKRAESDYEIAVQKAESDYETLQDQLEDAQENLDIFESSVGDCYYYASSSGTVLRSMVRAEDVLTSESVIFMYSNREEMTVTVSVDQDDIAKISVGDTASVEAQGYGSFEGTVTKINPVSASESRTSVTYEVTVTLPQDVGELPTNQSVSVIFGMGGRTNEGH